MSPAHRNVDVYLAVVSEGVRYEDVGGVYAAVRIDAVELVVGLGYGEGEV